VVTRPLTFVQRIGDLPPYLLAIETFHEGLVESGKKSVFHGRRRGYAQSVYIVVRGTRADGQCKVHDFVRPYVLGLPHRDIQRVIIMEATVLERSKILQNSWLEKPADFRYDIDLTIENSRYEPWCG
jgi:hypothetical protein